MAKRDKKGHLMIVGGGEDRQDEKVVLRRFVELAGGKSSCVVVLTTASQLAAEDPDAAKEIEREYRHAFEDIGVCDVKVLHVHDRSQAALPEHLEAVASCTGIFMSGGSQERLVSVLGGTAIDQALREAYFERGACLGGTSAGASALSQVMVLGGPSEIRPMKGALPLAPGLGFIGDVLIDQHFHERQRLARLMSVIALNPAVIGIGVDEDTALVITPNAALEVVGAGSVTIVDGRDMTYTNFNEIKDGEALALTDIRLHMLPPGFRFVLGKTEDSTMGRASAVFEGLIERVVSTR